METQELNTSAFEHVNLNEIDPTFKPVPKGMRTLEIAKFSPRTIVVKKETSKKFGQTLALVDARFRIVNDPDFSGRSLSYTFWLDNQYDLKALRRLSDGIGTPQEAGEPLDVWVTRVGELAPPAQFKLFVDEVEDPASVDETTGKSIPVNKLKWNNVVAI